MSKNCREKIEQTEEEIWKDILGYEGCYQVSSWGRVKSLTRTIVSKCRWGGEKKTKWRGRILKPSPWADGHLTVHLSKNNVGEVWPIHLLVLRTFRGPCPEGMEGCHNNGNPGNNYLENLRWDTHKNNCRDTMIQNRYHRRLTKEEKVKIRELYQTGDYTIEKLRNMFKVSGVSIIKWGRSTKDL